VDGEPVVGHDLADRPQTNTARQIRVGGVPVELAVGDGAVWIWTSKDEMTPLRHRDRPAERPDQYRRTIDAIALGGGYVWISHSAAGTVTRINTTTRKLEGERSKLAPSP